MIKSTRTPFTPADVAMISEWLRHDGARLARLAWRAKENELLAQASTAMSPSFDKPTLTEKGHAYLAEAAKWRSAVDALDGLKAGDELFGLKIVGE